MAAPSPWVANGTVNDLPDWGRALLVGSQELQTTDHDGCVVCERQTPSMRHRMVRLPDAAQLTGEAFTTRARLAYDLLLDGANHATVFRIWNFIPKIGQLDDEGLDHYMRFNAARFDAYAATDRGSLPYPVASGVGHNGNDLVLHLFEGQSAINEVVNPRQVLPEHYSQRFGPLPPVFTRAALVENRGQTPHFLASGTASVRGEDTMFDHALDGQLAETMCNLQALLEEASRASGAAARLDTLLTYVVRPDDLAAVKACVKAHFNPVETKLEFRIGELCRSDLLVEIEGAGSIFAGNTTS